MIKKSLIATVPVLLLSASLQIQAAGQMSLEFNAASPSDQLAWVDVDEQTHLVSKDAEGKNWDPLGLDAKHESAVLAGVKNEEKALLKTVSAKKIELKSKKSAENIWNFIH
ncbi:MAG: hypothetical protein D6698_05840 [Gammaproteobacteria bacterium]|nr:MAG: hypothetical protein D6698_05840 [Gammaproteobacteria bacterium]